VVREHRKGDEADDGMPESALTGCKAPDPAPGSKGPEGTAPGSEGEVPTGTAALGAPDADPRSACAAKSA
jgi:hypothetical protein